MFKTIIIGILKGIARHTIEAILSILITIDCYTFGRVTKKYFPKAINDVKAKCESWRFPFNGEVSGLTFENQSFARGALNYIRNYTEFRNLSSISFHNCPGLRDEDFEAIAPYPIEELYVSSRGLNGEFLKYLTTPSLTRLTLKHMTFDSNCWKYLGNLSHLKNVAFTGLNCNDQTLEALSKLHDLSDVTIRCNKTPLQYDSLSKYPGLQSLNLLYVPNGGQALRVLSGSKKLRNLTLVDCNVCDNDLLGFESLRLTGTLTLDFNSKITDKSMESIARLRVCELSLAGTSITQHGLEILAEGSIAPKLITLELTDARQCELDPVFLQNRFPNLEEVLAIRTEPLCRKLVDGGFKLEESKYLRSTEATIPGSRLRFKMFWSLKDAEFVYPYYKFPWKTIYEHEHED